MNKQTAKQAQPATPTLAGGLLQRKCACGTHTIAGGECESCQKEKADGQMQRAATSAEVVNEVPPIVHDVLRSSGQPLDQGAQAFFEQRMGRVLGNARVTAHAPTPQRLSVSQPSDFHEREADHIAGRVLAPDEPLTETRARQAGEPLYDLSRIRVHTDERAAESARAVNALAFTVGNHVVFGAGRYSPRSSSGLRLLAHELAHTAQQGQALSRQHAPHVSASPISLMRACASAAVCKDIKTPSKLLEEAGKESNTRREAREKSCKKVPEDAACRADGHASRAVEVEKLVGGFSATRLRNVKGIFIDKDIEADFGALTTSCKNFVPPLATSGTCIVVPEKLEKDAATFNSTKGPLTIDGMERGQWRERKLEMLVHEAGHADFRSSFLKSFSDKFSNTIPNILGKPRPTCKKGDDSKVDIFSSLNELSAMVQEFPLRMQNIRISVSFATQADKDAELKDWTDHRITGTSQSITNSVKVVRCLCECQDANPMIQETIEFATSSWTDDQRKDLHAELLSPKWSGLNLDWPFDASGAPKKTP